MPAAISARRSSPVKGQGSDLHCKKKGGLIINAWRWQGGNMTSCRTLLSDRKEIQGKRKFWSYRPVILDEFFSFEVKKIPLYYLQSLNIA